MLSTLKDLIESILSIRYQFSCFISHDTNFDDLDWEHITNCTHELDNSSIEDNWIEQCAQPLF